MDYINKILCGNDLEILPKLPSESVSCVTCSPPYWGLRDYGIEPVIWDGDKDCEHIWGIDKKIEFKDDSKVYKNEWVRPSRNEFKKVGDTTKCLVCGEEFHGKIGQKFCSTKCLNTLNNEQRQNSNPKQCFCSICNAWHGSLGLEPTFELYIKHLCDIFDEVKRVLRKDGCIFVNLGDTYNSHSAKSKNVGGFEGKQMRNNQSYSDSKIAPKKVGVPDKSLCDIPYRFSIEMINRGWIKRNTIIWWKPNCMPSSADDRFTVDFEYLFFFTKNNKTLFWTNEKTLECVSKKPSGTKGIEGKDWEWRKCPNCQGEGTIIGKALKEGAAPRLMKGIGIITKNTKAFRVCPRCEGSGKIKYSFWTGHDYWFEQQFEEYAPDTLPRMERGMNVNKWTFGPDGQKPQGIYQPRLNKKRGYKTKQPDKGIQGPQYRGKDINYGRYGRNKRCVWKIPTKSFKEAHFATFPETLIEPIIKAGCPEFVCKKCGKARIKILEPTEEYKEYLGKGNLEEHHAGQETKTKFKVKANAEYKFRGYSDCGCNAGWESGINLDPFMGTGTTALVALKQRKRFIGIEIKQEYIEMTYKRIARVQQEIF